MNEKSEFHGKKIDEILEAYISSNSLFVKGVCLFYLAVHSIDLVLIQYSVSPNTHRGRKNFITQYLDEFTFSKFDQLLTSSIRIRYTGYSTEKIIQEMKENLEELINHLKKRYSLTTSVANKILQAIS